MATLLMLVLVLALMVPAPWYLCVLSVIGTVAHIGEESVWGRGGPFWAYYRAHFDRGHLPVIGTLAGLALFAALALIQIGLAIGGYLCGSELLLGGLIGARCADVLLSHVALRLRFPGPNPGLRTAPLYALEVGLVLWAAELRPSGLGFALGFGAFALFWAVSFLLRLMPRLHTVESVAAEIVKGLEDGTVRLR